MVQYSANSNPLHSNTSLSSIYINLISRKQPQPLSDKILANNSNVFYSQTG